MHLIWGPPYIRRRRCCLLRCLIYKVQVRSLLAICHFTSVSQRILIISHAPRFVNYFFQKLLNFFFYELCSKQSFKVISLFIMRSVRGPPCTEHRRLLSFTLFNLQGTNLHFPASSLTSVGDATVNEYITLAPACQYLFLLFLKKFFEGDRLRFFRTLSREVP